MSIYIHTCMIGLGMGERKQKPELRDWPFWKIGENGKITHSVTAKIEHFAFCPISVLGTVYGDDGGFKVSF